MRPPRAFPLAFTCFVVVVVVVVVVVDFKFFAITFISLNDSETQKVFVLVHSWGTIVQRPDNFVRWIRHYSASKIYFTLN